MSSNLKQIKRSRATAPKLKRETVSFRRLLNGSITVQWATGWAEYIVELYKKNAPRSFPRRAVGVDQTNERASC